MTGDREGPAADSLFPDDGDVDRTRHLDWVTTGLGDRSTWAALIDSLQEGFFVTNADGVVVEINTAFTELLGYRRDQLPVSPPFPWYTDQEHGRREYLRAVNAEAAGDRRGEFVMPMKHRDGRVLMIAATYNSVVDARGNRLVVGTVRDVTAVHETVQRESALARTNQRLSQARSKPEVLDVAVSELRELWHARRVLVAAPAEGGLQILATSPPERHPEISPEIRESISRLFALPPSHAMTTTTSGASTSGVGTTLAGPRRPLAVWLDLDPDRPFTGADETLLGLLCGSITQAAYRAHDFDQQHEVALALQRAVLGPSRLPPGFAVRYEPATRPLEVGGDWYDVVELADGRIGLAVGDCVGHGLAAAAAMGQLRSACRAGLLRAEGPVDTLNALDQFVNHTVDAALATVFCAVLDPVTGELVYSSAGHPPAVIAHADGAVESLERAGSVPLGVRRTLTRPSAEAVIERGAALLLYTDGLIERRGHPLEEGISRAEDLLVPDANAELLADRVMSGMRPDDGYADDVALLLYRRFTDLELSFPARPEQLRDARARLRGWLAGLDLDPLVSQDVLLAVGEACTNAVEHAYRDAEAQHVRMVASVTGRNLRVRVTDTGQWQPPRPDPHAHRGRGLTMIREMMDEVTVENQSTGTTIDMRMGLTS